MQKQYGDDLKKIMQEKEYNQRMEKYQAESEVQKLNANLEYKMQMEKEQRSKDVESRRQLNDHYQNVVNFKNMTKEQQEKEMAKLDSRFARQDADDY